MLAPVNSLARILRSLCGPFMCPWELSWDNQFDCIRLGKKIAPKEIWNRYVLIKPKAHADYMEMLRNLIVIEQLHWKGMKKQINQLGIMQIYSEQQCVHPCAKVMALFFKCENFQTLTFLNFLKLWVFQTEVLVSIYVKFHWNRPQRWAPIDRWT